MTTFVETARLRMRPHRLDDLAASYAMWSDERVVRHIGGRVFTEEEVWARLLRYAGHWALLGYGYWVVEEREGGAFVGEVGFADFHRALDPALGDRPEAGWVLSPSAHGRGYASEALAAAHAWAAPRFTTSTVCIIDPDNAASIRVAEKAGYREIARTTYHGSPTVVFERPR